MKQDIIEQTNETSFNRFSLKSVIPFLIILSLYSLWVYFALNGFRSDHFILITAITIIYFLNSTGRKLVYGYGFMIFYWFLFDSIRLFPNYEYNTLHVGDLYHMEKALFGILHNGNLITANELFGIYNNTFLDIYTAIIYIAWIPVPFVFGLFLFFSKRRVTLVHFWFTFLTVGVLGWTFQYMYPAAAPWYVEMYGTDSAFQVVPGNPGRLINFDKFFGVNLFEGMYSLNANVYAAVPSLHCAFPIVQLFFAVKHKLKWWTAGYIILMLSTWFAAVYTNHHYIIDVVTGIATGLLAITVYSLLMKTRFKTFLDNYGSRVT